MEGLLTENKNEDDGDNGDNAVQQQLFGGVEKVMRIWVYSM